MYSIANLPTIATGMIFDSICFMQGYGCAIAHTNLLVHCAAHLYAACRFAGLIKDASAWRDMEFFLERHSMFSNTKPTSDPFSLVSHFYLSLGIRGCTLAKVRADSSFPKSSSPTTYPQSI